MRKTAALLWIFALTATASAHAQEFSATATVDDDPDVPDEDEAASRVTRTQLEERMPRSAPDALRYEPGVYIQQTAHGQASPFVRGMTGQQVVHLFDGVRMNNGIYRQGPNQYFFTVNSRTLHDLEVQRGSASLLYGSDALGGAILARSRRGPLDPYAVGSRVVPRAYGRFASADLEGSGRAEVEGRFENHTAFLAGVGYRAVDRLESGGVVDHLADVEGSDRGSVAPWVPRFEEEADHPTDTSRWRRQRGTGFDTFTYDLRVDHALSRDVRVTGAIYGFMQGDAPRTDQCPPREAPASECLTIASQDRTLGYLALRGDPAPRFRDVALILSWQNHHEVRRKDRPRSFVRFDSTDDVDTLGVRFFGTTPITTFGDAGALDLRYGLDYYADSVSSESAQTFTDIDRRFALSRGQYVEGSTYVSGGLFTEVETRLTRWLSARAGARLALVDARSPGDAASATRAFSSSYGAVVGRAGVRAAVLDDDDAELAVHLNWDQGFRAPNLDDLTSRQQAGPGFQFENPDLTPERTNTVELGAALDTGSLKIEGWGFATILDDAIVRAVRNADDCPPATPQCNASRTQFQLVNAVGTGTIFGAEGGATVYLPADVTLRATVSYAWGESPGFDSRGETRERVPISRVPPLNGTVEGRWRHLATGIYAAAALRWATDQTRLAPSDLGDARIPVGGTPGYAVVDLRAGIRWSRHVRLSLVFENVFDAAYRLHGSSVNGAGRGVLAELVLGL